MKDILKIENSSPIQSNFLGFNAVYHGYQALYDSCGRSLPPDLCDLEADRAKDLNLKIARTFYKWYSYDFEKNCWDWENSYDFNRFCDWMQRMKDRNIDVGINAGWVSVCDLVNNGWNAPSPFNTDNIWGNCVERYADWVAESVHQLVEVRGFNNLKYLFMFTEPGVWYGKFITDPNTHIDGIEAWCQCVRAVDKKLRDRNLRKYVKLVGANEGNSLNPTILKWFAENEPDIVDIYSSHYYLTHLYPYENEVLPKGCAHIFGGDFAGARIQQSVRLKPFTEYKFSFFAKSNAKTSRELKGGIVYGAFKLGENDNGFIQSGNQATNSLDENSVEFLNAAKISDDWQKISVSFKTPEYTENSVVGVFFDLNSKENSAILTTGFSLKESACETELISDGGLSDFKSYKIYPEIYGELFSDPYDLISDYIKRSLEFIPKGKEFWWDEFNIINEGCWTKPVPCKLLPDKESPEFGTFLAVTNIAFLNSGIQSPWAWTLFDQQWPGNHAEGKDRFFDGVHKHGVMPYLKLSKIPYPAYFSRRILGLTGGSEGTKVFKGECTRYIKTSLVESPEGDITLLVANQAQIEKTVTIELEKGINKILYKYSYDPSTVSCKDNIPPLKSEGEIFVENQFVITLPAGGVVVYHSKNY